MTEPPAPNSPEAMRIARAFRDQECIVKEWDGRPSFWCHKRAARRWNDMPVERWDGGSEDV